MTVKVELGRPVSESHSLFKRNCWLRTGSSMFLLISYNESLRDVLESQSLFTRNCWLWTGSFLLLLKKASGEEETLPDRFCEKYRQSDFLYSRNDQYKIVDLHFFFLEITYRKISTD